VQTAEDALKKMPDEFEKIKQKLKKGIEYFDLLEKTYLKDNCEEWMKKELGLMKLGYQEIFALAS
jgi:hypothetical protein